MGLRAGFGSCAVMVGGEMGVRSDEVLAVSNVWELRTLAPALDALDKEPSRLERVSTLGRIVDSEERVASVPSEERVDMDVIEGSVSIDVEANVELTESDATSVRPRPFDSGATGV